MYIILVYNFQLVIEILRVTILKPMMEIWSIMNMIKTIVILGILIAPYLLMQHANAEEVTVQIADGAKKVDNGKF